MRSHGSASTILAPPAGAAAAAPPPGDRGTLRRLFPYLWGYKWRVITALTLMVGAKVANVGVPLLLKELIDAMSFKPSDPTAVLVVPVSLLLVYRASKPRT